MKFGMKIIGGDEMAAHLRTLPDAVRKRRLYAVLRVGAEPIRAYMAQKAPREPGAPDLAENIGISAAPRVGSVMGGRWNPSDEFEAAVAVGPTKDFFYGLFQEYGTSRHGAQPFARPAFDSQAPKSLGIIGTELWELIRKANGSGSKPGGGLAVSPTGRLL